jgi:hypothetical protein
MSDVPKCEECGKQGVMFVGRKLLCGDCVRKVEKVFDNMITEALR